MKVLPLNNYVKPGFLNFPYCHFPNQPTPIFQDQAIQVLSESLRPENEILHRTLDELEKAQAENARLLRDRSGTSPSLAREALKRSRDRVAELEVFMIC